MTGGNTRHCRRFRASRAGGSVLVIALMLLILLTLTSTTAMRARIMEMKMAGNEEARINALQLTQSIVDDVLSHPENFSLSGTESTRACDLNSNDCSQNSVVVDESSIASASVGRNTVALERLEPALSPAPRKLHSSANAFNAARFEITVESDGAASAGGSSGIVQGVLVLVPRREHSN